MSCVQEGTSCHYLLPLYHSILDFSDLQIVKVLLHGKKSLDLSSNINKLNVSMMDILLKPKGLTKDFSEVKINETMVTYNFLFPVYFLILGISFTFSFFYYIFYLTGCLNEVGST